MTKDIFIQVAIPSPLRRTFDYRPPANCPVESLKPGVRVQVPFGNRRMIGIITGCSNESDFPAGKIKAADKLIDQLPVIDGHLMSLYLWAADYYQFPVGQALQTSLPAQIRKGKPAEEKQMPSWQASAAGENLNQSTLKNAPRQLQVLSLIIARKKITAAALKESISGEVVACLKTLADKGLIEEISTPVSSKNNPGEIYGDDAPLQLNKQQQSALTAIRKDIEHYSVSLLEGVTGSGKTEIYLQAIADVLEKGLQALVLVPEISLTPQTLRRFESRFNREIAVFHSGLTGTQRLSAWLRAGNGKADIIIGTRSAIFTPLARPGLIIVDEEHDASYKQQDGFRYSGRDLAIYRARQLDIPVILGTATPSLESLNNALAGRFQYLQLTERAGDASHPEYRLLDLKGQELTDGFSNSLIDMIRSHLGRKNQVLIFLNRRGFAPILLCRDCGWIATCPRCDSSYTLHRNPPRLSCHHCESQKALAQKCEECSSTDLAAMGLGTEKTEQTVRELFPEIPVHRIDRDSTRNRETLHDIIEKVDSGDPCILVGTQMLSKGHHFPNVTLVAVLDADGGLFSADFRGQEQMGQLLIQVAGRAGRGETQGEVVIQTYNSTHPTLQALIRHGYGPFARKLLEERQLGRLPPFSYMALIRAEASSQPLPFNFLQDVINAVQHTFPDLSIIGPMPSPMEKRAGLFRMQLIIEADKRSTIQKYLSLLIPLMENHPEKRKVRWSVDVDPLDFT
ncbi:MAG: primosomal protein N' (replication factor Y) [Pseudohongiellaceae bacterium]